MAASGPRWPPAPLRELTSKIGSGATPRGGENDYKPDGVSLIRSLNVYDFEFSEDDLAHIDEDQAAALDNVIVQQDDILLNITGASVARCCLVNPKVLPARVNQHVAIVRVRPDRASARFVLYCINSLQYKSYLLALAQGGATREALTKKTIQDFNVPCPPLPIQRKIAAILSTYDDLIENNLRRIKILEEMARSLYREWFVAFRFPGHQKVRMVNSPIGKIPEGWEVAAIGDVCDRVTDGSHHSPPSVQDGMPMASSKDLSDWGIDLGSCRLISPDDYEDLVRNDCKPKKDDVLITKDGANYLKRMLVVREDLDLVLLSSVAILRPNDRINPHLLVETLKAPENKDRLKNYVTGAAIPRIVLKDFKRFTIVLPQQHIQEEWAALARPCTELIWNLNDRIDTLRQTRDLLLPKLISGNPDVSKLDIKIRERSA